MTSTTVAPFLAEGIENGLSFCLSSFWEEEDDGAEGVSLTFFCAGKAEALLSVLGFAGSGSGSGGVKDVCFSGWLDLADAAPWERVFCFS